MVSETSGEFTCLGPVPVETLHELLLMKQDGGQDHRGQADRHADAAALPQRADFARA